MNKKTVIVAVLAIVVVGIIVFGPKLQNTETNTVDVFQQDPIKIGIVAYPGYGTFLIADEKGFFEKEGVNVEVIQLATDALVPAFMGEEIDVSISTPDFITIIGDGGVDAAQFLISSMTYGADGILVADDTQKVSDLKGKKVYVTLGFPGHFFVRSVAEQAGLELDDIELVNMNPDQIGSAFVSGDINIGATWEPWLSQANKRENGRVLVTSRDVPGIVLDSVMAKREFIDSHREELRKINKAIFAANEFWKNNREEGNTIAARGFGLSPEEFDPMRDTIKLADYEFNLYKFDRDNERNIYELTDKAGTFYLADGVISEKKNAGNFVDDSILQDLYE